jgi:hypothetical protein
MLWHVVKCMLVHFAQCVSFCIQSPHKGILWNWSLLKSLPFEHRSVEFLHITECFTNSCTDITLYNIFTGFWTSNFKPFDVSINCVYVIHSPCINRLYMTTVPTKCIQVYWKKLHNDLLSVFGQPCGHPQGGEIQKINALKFKLLKCQNLSTYIKWQP